MKVFAACISVGIAAGVATTAYVSNRGSNAAAVETNDSLRKLSESADDTPRMYTQEEFKEYMERALTDFAANGGTFGDITEMIEDGDFDGMDEGFDFLEEMDTEGGALRALKKDNMDDDDDDADDTTDINYQECPATRFPNIFQVKNSFNRACVRFGFSRFFLPNRFINPFSLDQDKKIMIINECRFSFLKFPRFVFQSFGFVPFSMTNVKDADMEKTMYSMFNRPCFTRQAVARQILRLKLQRQFLARIAAKNAATTTSF